MGGGICDRQRAREGGRKRERLNNNLYIFLKKKQGEWAKLFKKTREELKVEELGDTSGRGQIYGDRMWRT